MRTGFFLPLLLSILASATLNAAEISFRVSDLLIDPIKGIVDSGEFADVDCIFEGSVNALAELHDGRADLIIAAVPDGRPLPEGMVSIPFVFDVATVVVNNSNPIKEISLNKLTVAFTKTSTGAKKWGALGLKDAWAERSIAAYLPQSSNTITLELFRNMTVKDDGFRDGIGVWTSRQQLERVVREQGPCLVLMRGLNIPGGGKALSISIKDGTDSFSYPPTESSIFYGDYALRLPFYILFRKNAPQGVKDLATRILSDSVAAKLSAAGFVPAPKSERDSRLHF